MTDTSTMRKLAVIALLVLPLAACTSSSQPPDAAETCDDKGCVIAPVSVCVDAAGREVWGPSPEFDACMAAQP